MLRIIILALWFSNNSLQENYLEGFFQHKFLGPIPRISDSADLMWGLGAASLISSKFPGNAAVLVHGPLLKTTTLEQFVSSGNLAKNADSDSVSLARGSVSLQL